MDLALGIYIEQEAKKEDGEKMIVEILKKHQKEIKECQENCDHPKDNIKINIDSSMCGRGSRWPHIVVVCQKCGLTLLYMGINPRFYEKTAEMFRTMDEIIIPNRFVERFRITRFNSAIGDSKYRLNKNWGK